MLAMEETAFLVLVKLPLVRQTAAWALSSHFVSGKPEAQSSNGACLEHTARKTQVLGRSPCSPDPCPCPWGRPGSPSWTHGESPPWRGSGRLL